MLGGMDMVYGEDRYAWTTPRAFTENPDDGEVRQDIESATEVLCLRDVYQNRSRIGRMEKDAHGSLTRLLLDGNYMTAALGDCVAERLKNSDAA